ncbi:uncharacterized protein ACR2FA_008001 [Aphomia sociella]
MTPLILLIALMVGHSTAVVQLSCSDNATCIDHMAKEMFRSLREQRSVKLFDTLTIEPLGRRQARSNESPLSRFLNNHAFSFDWADFTFRVAKPQDRSDVLDLEVFEGRSAAKDVSDQNPKKSSSKVEEENVDDKGNKIGLRRRHKKKVLMAVIPLLFGMKSAGAVIFAMAIVTVLTLKAFVASKMALLVTVGMAVKKLYESYSNGVGLQNHPYLYSQYPIDFPSASSHAYSVSGVSPQFGSPEMYNPTALGGSHPHTHELLQQNDASAQSSQQAPTLLVNSTRAAERWDGYRRRPMFYGTSRATSDSYSGYQHPRH